VEANWEEWGSRYSWRNLRWVTIPGFSGGSEKNPSQDTLFLRSLDHETSFLECVFIRRWKKYS
jgi:hypothetical protein